MHLLRTIVALVVSLAFAASCSVATSDVAVTATAGGVAATSSPAAAVQSPQDVLPVIGPVPGASHWHAAYVVRICDDVLDPFDSTDDPLGIHSHSDGIMHVHPFFVESGYEAATLQVFADAMDFAISDGELTLPGGGTWRDGDLCNGVPGRVFVDRWRDPNPESSVERIFTGIEDVRYLADGELYQLAFAPADSPPVVPPSVGLLPQVSNLAPPSDPWIDVDASASLAQARFWPVQAVAAPPCDDGAIEERVLSGPTRCFSPGPAISGIDAVVRARAVLFNRSPAVEIVMTPALQDMIDSHFLRTDDPFGLGIEVQGRVITAPLIARPPLSERLVVSGGFTAETATALAEILSG